MKRTKHILLTAVMLLGTLTASAHDFKVNGIYYKFNNNDLTDLTVAVTYMGRSSGEYNNEYTGHISIPSTVTYRGKKYRVTEIDNAAFCGCNKLTSVTIPSSVTSIEDAAFEGCSSLSAITIPSSVTSIGDGAFNSCGLKRVVLEDGRNTLSLGYGSWWRYIPGRGTGLFNDCPLESVYIGRNISYEDGREAGYSPFWSIETLKSVTIGKQVTNIGENTFSGCNLTSVNCPEQFKKMFSIVVHVGDFIFKDNVLIGYRGTNNIIELPKNFQGGEYSIGDYAFRDCSSLTSINIPNSVTTIGGSAFEGCSSLTSINIPNSVTTIGGSAFRGCTNLTTITIPESVTSIERLTFSGCSRLTTITIPAGVTSIGDYAFWDCESLTAITIPEGVTSIGESAFRGCTNLTTITIPESVTSIERDAFRGCSRLKTIINFSDLSIQKGSSNYGEVGYHADRVINLDEFIDDYAFKTIDGVHYMTGYVGEDTELSLPENYRGENFRIAEHAFRNCYSLTSITIPSSVTSIEMGAFRGCSSLASITIPENSQLTSIGAYAFFNCRSLTSITIPSNVTSIGSCYAFYGCTALKEVIFADGSKTLSLGYNINLGDGQGLFYDCPLESVYIGRNLSYNTTGCGYSPFYKEDKCPTISLGSSITSISPYLFYRNTKLTSITIPEGVTSIGDYAFRDCSSLTTVIAHKSLKKIFKENRGRIFPNCSNLNKITYVK